MLKQIASIGVFICALVMAPLQGAEQSPTQVVQTTVDAILALVKDKALEKEDRRAKIRAIIEKRFDFRAMSQRTLATNWKKATQDEQQQFVGLFGRLIQNSYLGKVEAYTSETVEYRNEEVKSNKAVVDTIIITSSTEIPVNYRMYRKGSEWLVYDVLIEGVSLISSYRSTYQEIVKKDGFPGLFAKMEEKLKELDNQPS